MNREDPLAAHRETLRRLVEDLQGYHPKAIVLFGSMARHLSGQPADRLPNDIDLLLIGQNAPAGIDPKGYLCEVELHFFHQRQLAEIARSLRYDSRPVLLAKLYGSVLARAHARNVIAACLLLGPGYRDIGIEQIETQEGKTDPRDYSVHQVLFGQPWWDRISAYARNRRGPWRRFSDRIAGQERFEE